MEQRIIKPTLDEKVIKKWAQETKFKESRRSLLIDLFKDLICWGYANGYDIADITINGLSKMLVGMGYIKVQSYNGMYFLMGEGQVIEGESLRNREEVGGGK